MNISLARLDLRLRRRALVGTAVGAMAYLLLVIAAYPSFRGDTSLSTMLESNPSAAAALGISGSITSTSGWLSANMYANLAPLLALMLTIGYGAAAIAGANADGQLGLVATLPIKRASIVCHKVAELVVVSLVVPVASFVVCLFAPRFQLTPDWGSLIGVTATLGLLALDFGVIAMFLGAITHSRSAALGITSGLAAASYLISSLAPVVAVAERARWLSPFFWAVGHDQLARGVTPLQLVALVSLAAIVAAATVPVFRRMDVQ